MLMNGADKSSDRSVALVAEALTVRYFCKFFIERVR